jgi:superoxide dismutase, Fe-Mn family
MDMAIELPPLPYPKDALEPYISTKTLSFHYDKHHHAYVDSLNKAIHGTEDEGKDLETLIATSQGDVYNNAAQTWNHTFYWNSLKPDGGGEPNDDLAIFLKQEFGSVKNFRTQLADAAKGKFGSGWAWLVLDARGCLAVINSSDADNPLRMNLIPLVTIDVWEHAYYLDYQNRRDTYVEAVLDRLLNWDFIAANIRRTKIA